MNYTTTLVNFAGGTTSFQATLPPDILMIQTANSLFTNESGDSMHGNLDMLGNKFMNVAYPENKKMSLIKNTLTI